MVDGPLRVRLDLFPSAKLDNIDNMLELLFNNNIIAPFFYMFSNEKYK